MNKEDFAPPGHLSPASQELWRELIPRRGRSPGRLAMLTAALESRDRADQARTEIAKTGLTTTTKATGACHLHPLLRIEREQRQLFAKLWRDLGFAFDSTLDGRMPNRDGLV